MAADNATAALRHLGQDELDTLLAALDTANVRRLRRLLSHPPDTAGGLMSVDVVTAEAGEPARLIRSRVAEHPPVVPALATVFVIDEERRPLGAVSPAGLMGDAVEPSTVPVLRLDTPAEDVINLFALHDVLALPVVDAEGRLAGAVAIDDVLEELIAERLPGKRRYRPERRALATALGLRDRHRA